MDIMIDLNTLFVVLLALVLWGVVRYFLVNRGKKKLPSRNSPEWVPEKRKFILRSMTIVTGINVIWFSSIIVISGGLSQANNKTLLAMMLLIVGLTWVIGLVCLNRK